MDEAAQTPTIEECAEAAKVRELLPDAILKVKEHLGATFLCLDRNHLLGAVSILRDNPDLEYKYFVECLGADYSRWAHARDFEERFEVIYNLFSLKHNRRIFLKVGVNDGQKIPSLMPLYTGAEYPQREITDLYGIIFEGHEPRAGERFLLPDDWKGFPLRKEYPLGGEDVLFDKQQRGPAVEDMSSPHAGESFVGKTGTQDVSGR
jgi:NADH-quinone oxidoreductase subunit C